MADYEPHNDTIDTASNANIADYSLLGINASETGDAKLSRWSASSLKTMFQTGAIADGDKGDITVSASGATWTIDNNAVTYSKIQDVSATDRLLGRSSSGAGDIEEITCTAAGRALLDDADAAAQRTTLGAQATLSTISSTVTFNDQLINRYGLETNSQSGTTYTLQASDNGKQVTITNANPITLTVPTGLPTGFNCLITQGGAGQITVSASGTTINNRQSHTKTAGQHAVCSLLPTNTTNTYRFVGDTSS